MSQYAGKWFEIYRYEQTFSFGCKCVHVKYTKRDDGKVGVKNCCTRGMSNEPGCVEATAVLSYPKQEPLEGRLNVTFFGRKYALFGRVISMKK